MKTSTIVSIIILAIGLYVEYEKDSSFSSLDMGSVLIGAGAGSALATML